VTAGPGDLHLKIATVALGAISRYGFALGGGCALVAHGLVTRPTEDVDLFTDIDGGIRDATGIVLGALRSAGLDARLDDDTSDLSDLFYGMDDAFTEFVVSNGPLVVRMSLGRMSRRHEPTVMTLGPVMHLDDLIGSKVCAFATRGEVRDYIDVAAALPRYGLTRLMALAAEHDPGLTAEDFADAARRLEDLPDEPFARYGLDVDAVATMRAAFADWSR